MAALVVLGQLIAPSATEANLKETDDLHIHNNHWIATV